MDLNKTVEQHERTGRELAEAMALESARVFAWPGYQALAEELAEEEAAVYVASYSNPLTIDVYLAEQQSTLPRRLAARGITFTKVQQPNRTTGIQLIHESDGLRLRVNGYLTPGCRIETRKRTIEVTENVSVCGDDEVSA